MHTLTGTLEFGTNCTIEWEAVVSNGRVIDYDIVGASDGHGGGRDVYNDSPAFAAAADAALHEHLQTLQGL